MRQSAPAKSASAEHHAHPHGAGGDSPVPSIPSPRLARPHGSSWQSAARSRYALCASSIRVPRPGPASLCWIAVTARRARASNWSARRPGGGRTSEPGRDHGCARRAPGPGPGARRGVAAARSQQWPRAGDRRAMRTLNEALEALDADPDDKAALMDLRAAFEEHLWARFPFIEAGHRYWLQGRVEDRARSVECWRHGRCTVGLSAGPCQACEDFWLGRPACPGDTSWKSVTPVPSTSAIIRAYIRRFGPPRRGYPPYAPCNAESHRAGLRLVRTSDPCLSVFAEGAALQK